jgi:type IV pilus assembly protein PilA
MLPKLQERRGALTDESAFTLIELLVVLIIIGVLLAIAVPSYLGFKQKAEQTAAASDVREAIPSAEAFYSDNNNSYAAITAAGLKTYDSGISTALQTVKPENSGAGYCISAKVGAQWAHVVGPGGQVTLDGPAAADPCP